jgi:predicted amidohydrolase
MPARAGRSASPIADSVGLRSCFHLCLPNAAAVHASARQPITLRDRPEDAPLIRGGSCIVSPMGEVIAGPLHGEEGLVTTKVDLDAIVRARFDLDVAGQ